MTQVVHPAFFVSFFFGMMTTPIAQAETNPLNFIKMVSATGSSKVKFVPFTSRDLVTQAPMSTASVELFDGRIVPASHYLTELNRIERELTSYGVTLRAEESELGTVAKSTNEKPNFETQTPVLTHDQGNARWSHRLSHPIARVSSDGQVVQRKNELLEPGVVFDRTTSHTISGRFIKSELSSLAQVTQRVVRLEDGSEHRESQVYVNGKQLFRHGNINDTEARIWATAFDVPFKEITVPVGPGTVQAKVGVRGQVNLDLEVTPSRSTGSGSQFSLNFKPQINAVGYLSTATSPTNVGDAGIEGAVTLAKNTLDIHGAAGFTRALKIEVKEATIDNSFEGFEGRIVGYANVTLPGKKADGTNKKRFEKEFYSWEGVKVQQRLYEYKAPTPQPSND